jgi:hypothetical protein
MDETKRETSKTREGENGEIETETRDGRRRRRRRRR